MPTVEIHVPIRLPSLSNERLHWRRMARIKRDQKYAVGLLLSTQRKIAPPLTVTITRVGPRRLDDDNLEAACKYVRDEVARWVGLDDGSPLYEWRYNQRPGQYEVVVRITDEARRP